MRIRPLGFMRGRGFGPRRLALSAAFASALLLSGCSDAQPAGAPPATQVSTPLEPIAPAGDVHGPITFSWRGTSDDQVVKIYIVDAAERAVTDFEARGQSVVAPTIIVAAIQPGEKMGWRIAAIDQNGEPVRLSRLTSFRWEPQ